MQKKPTFFIMFFLGFFGPIVLTPMIISKLTDDEGMGLFSVALGFVLGFAWIFFLNDKYTETENKTPKRAASVADDPFAVFDRVDKLEREKYPENVRNITWDDIRKKADKRRTEIYSSASSFNEEKELADIAVKLFRSRDNVADAPRYVVKAALKFIGYDEELVDALYEMLYNESTRVYNVLRP